MAHIGDVVAHRRCGAAHRAHIVNVVAHRRCGGSQGMRESERLAEN